MIALLERVRIQVQIDIGFSDELTSKAEAIEYPNILPDLKTIRMKGYPKEAVVAEKFHAMIRHGDLNSRMKDYYDIWLISETFEFDGGSLQKAIEVTFNNRNTDIPNERPSSMSAEFARTSQTRWINFLNKSGLDRRAGDFENVLDSIWKFLEQPVKSAVNQTLLTSKWIPQKGWR